MRKKISTLPFKETKEQSQQLDALMEKHGTDVTHLMTLMHEAQGIYGYLSFEVLERISESMRVPLEKVYGIATFYAQYSLTPKGKYHISVCLGTACYVKGAGDLFNEISEILGIAADESTEDGLFSLAASRCIGACGLAPVLTVNEDVFGRLSVDDAERIVEQYKEKEAAAAV